MSQSYTPIQLFELVGLVFISIVGLIGNSLVLYVFISKIRRRGARAKPFELLLSILAVVDLLSTFFMPGLFIYFTSVYWKKWHFGYIGCKILRSLPVFFITISQGILIIIAYQRYRIVKDPLRNKLTRSSLLPSLGILVIVAALLVSPWTITLKIAENKANGIQTCNSSSMEGEWIGRVLNFIFECFNLTRGLLAALTIIVFSQMTTKALVKNNDFYKNNPVLRLRVQNVRRLLRTITIAFSLLVIPADAFHVVYHTMTWTMQLTPEMFKYILNIHVMLKLLQSSNSAFNFIIYAGMKGDVNNFLRQLSKRVMGRSRCVVNSTGTEEKKGEGKIPRKLTTLSTISSTAC